LARWGSHCWIPQLDGKNHGTSYLKKSGWFRVSPLMENSMKPQSVKSVNSRFCPNGHKLLLVGGLEHVLFFHIYWECHIIPTVTIRPSFFRGVYRSTTNQWL
jgi:hypothetical protein